MSDILIHPLTQDAFAAFGDIITLKDSPDKLINQGLCGRHHDLAALDFGPDGSAGISLFDATPRSLRPPTPQPYLRCTNASSDLRGWYAGCMRQDWNLMELRGIWGRPSLVGESYTGLLM